MRTNHVVARGGIALAAAVSMGLGAGCASAPKQAVKDEAPKAFAFWPQFPDEPRIQFVKSVGSSADIREQKSDRLETLVFGEESAKDSAIQKPYGVAMRGGRIYVCDIRSPALVVLDLTKKQTRLVGVTGVNRLSHPVDVAVADDGVIYVADNERGAIVVFDAKERYARAIGFEKLVPVGVAVHGDRLYVCDKAGQVVDIFDRRDGKRLGVIGSVGDEDGQFRVPLGVDTDAAGNVYVVDMMRFRVQKFSAEGTYIGGVGTLGDYAGSFARPKQIAVDKDGVMYVVDAAFQNVQMFDDQFRLLMSFGAAGAFPGAMNLPAGVCVSDDPEGLEAVRGLLHPGFEPKRLVVVTNQFGANKVAVYAMGGCKAGYTAADLAASAATVSTGLGTTQERLKLSSPGDAPPEPRAPAQGPVKP